MKNDDNTYHYSNMTPHLLCSTYSDLVLDQWKQEHVYLLTDILQPRYGRQKETKHGVFGLNITLR